jgi:hypothetical protein
MSLIGDLRMPPDYSRGVAPAVLLGAHADPLIPSVASSSPMSWLPADDSVASSMVESVDDIAAVLPAVVVDCASRR